MAIDIKNLGLRNPSSKAVDYLGDVFGRPTLDLFASRASSERNRDCEALDWLEK